MEKRIYNTILILGIALILISCLTMGYLFYDLHIDQLREELRASSQLFLKSEMESYKGQEMEFYIVKEAPKIEDDRIYYIEKLKDSYLLAHRPAYKLSNILTASLLISFSLSIIFFVLSNIISSNLSYELIHPLKEVSSSVEDILRGDRLDEAKNYQELEPLVSQINAYKDKVDFYIANLEASNDFRREFTANVSHELKTPLTSINGYAELLMLGMVKSEDIKSVADIIYREGQRLLQLIDSIIELSNLDNPKLKLDFQELDLYQLSKDVMEKIRAKAQIKDIDLELKGQSSLLRANPRMMEDLVYNLLDNGIKYNRQGGRLVLSVNSFEDQVVLVCRDNGIGISQDKLDRIFERFYMVDKSRSDKSSGLGLSIVKHIVDLHRGEISLRSKENIGTEISIKLKS